MIGSVETTLLVLLLVVVFGPIVTERFRIPGIVGLIFGGMLFGPFVIDWLPATGLVADLGSIGILYLMFLAGLSFDLRAFFENRNSAIVYGLLGFIIPFVLSVAVVIGSENIETLGALLIGAMWASNTLVAYGEVQAAGLQGNRAVSAAVSAGVVADLLSLTVLAFATATAVIDIEPGDLPLVSDVAEFFAPENVEPSTPDPALPLWLGLPLLAVVCFWALPRLAQWFFVRIGQTRSQRFVFSLVVMSAGASVALMGGMEGLIGAFLAGLGMNHLVPTRGPLMERLDFVGTSIFVPAFLVSIGLNIDPAVLIDLDTIGLGLLFTGFVVVGKGSAALITGWIFRLSPVEVGLMSSLSFGQAASTLAIAQVGLTLGMFDQRVVNAAVIAIVVTALITSYATRFFVRRVPPPQRDQAPLGEKVLLDVHGDDSDLATLIDLAARLAEADDGLVVPFGVGDRADRQVITSRVERASATASARGLDSEGVVRFDDSFPDGVVNLVDEIDASLAVLSWGGPHFALDFAVGNEIDAVGSKSPVPTMAVRVLNPWNRIVVALGKTNAQWRRDDAALALDVIRRLRPSDSVPVVVLAHDRDVAVELLGRDVDEVELITDPEQRTDTLRSLGSDDLVVAAAHVLRDMPPVTNWRFVRTLGSVNLVVVAGPHRLTVSQGVSYGSLSSTINALTTDQR